MKKRHLQQHQPRIDVDTDTFISFVKEITGVELTLYQETMMRKMYENRDIGLYVRMPRKQDYNIMNSIIL